jgi:hypothetical protein
MLFGFTTESLLGFSPESRSPSTGFLSRHPEAKWPESGPISRQFDRDFDLS